MQITQNSKHNNWLEILAGEDYRNSGERRLKFIASRETVKQREHRSAQRRQRRQHSDHKHVQKQRKNTIITLQMKPMKRGNTDCRPFKKC